MFDDVFGVTNHDKISNLERGDNYHPLQKRIDFSMVVSGGTQAPRKCKLYCSYGVYDNPPHT